MKIKKVIVLGSNSFSGNNLVNFLLNKGIYVIGISRSNEHNMVMSSYYKNKFKKSNFKFYKLDINNDLKKILKITNSFKPDVIVNYLAQGDVRHSWNNPKQWYQTNCMGIVNYTSELINSKFLKKYLAISTPEVFGSSNKYLFENSNFNPSTPYAASKLAGDLHLLTLYKKYNFPVLFSRSSNVYGEYQQLYRIIPKTIIKIKLGEIIELHGRGQTKRDFININDLNNALYVLINKGKIGESYNIANKNKLISIYDLVKLICNILNVSDMKNIMKLIDENFGQDSKYFLNTEKIRNLGWSEKITLDKGIKNTILWINKNWSLIEKMPHEYIHKK
tara:strand:- start:433 stop:1434 length:1002 start_codon:yes stop_codon:yes gene_type:complete